MNMLCLACGAHYVGPTFSCRFCGSVLPAIALSEVPISRRHGGTLKAEAVSGTHAEVPASAQINLSLHGQESLAVEAATASSVASISSTFPDTAANFQFRPRVVPSQNTHGKIDKPSAFAIGALLVVIAGIGGNYFFSAKSSSHPSPSYSQNPVAASPMGVPTPNSSTVSALPQTKTETIVIQEFECGDQCGLIVRRGKRPDEYYLCAIKEGRPDSNIPICQVIFGTGGAYPNVINRTVTLVLKQDNAKSDSFWIADGRLHPVDTGKIVPNPSLSYSIPAPIVRVGDAYTYETVDLIEPKLNNVTNREIVEVSPSGFVMLFVNAKSKYTRRLSYDSNLNLISTRFGENDGANFSPALQYFKFPLQSGESWSSSSTESNIKTGKIRTHVLKGSVGGMEQVTVPAGTFKAYRITIQSELQEDGQVSTGQDISWYAPDVRRTVKSELESRDSMGKIGRRNINLTAYSFR